MGVTFAEKNHYVTLEWPISRQPFIQLRMTYSVTVVVV